MEALGANRAYSFQAPFSCKSYLLSCFFLYTFEGMSVTQPFWDGLEGDWGSSWNEKIAWREYTNLGMI